MKQSSKGDGMPFIVWCCKKRVNAILQCVVKWEAHGLDYENTILFFLQNENKGEVYLNLTLMVWLALV